MFFRLSLVLTLLGLLALLAVTRPARAEPVEIHYAPAENLERVDVALIAAARDRIDLAAFDLTDWPVIDALVDARRRGVAIRIVLDPSEKHALNRMREIAGAIRMKPPGPYMHLKSYLVDGGVLRPGSANFTASGLKQQDNDIVVLRQPDPARAFEERYERLWAEARPLGKTEARAAPQAEAQGGCAIKGNVNRKGERIYQLPGSPGYDRVTMDKGLGERWFCSEQEAVAAGWRRSRQR